MQARVLVIGIGNPYCGDDGAGIAVARELARRVHSGIRVIEHGGDGAALIEAWKGTDSVVVVDAIQSGATAGTIRRLDAAHEEIPAELFRHSTHAFGVADAIELARTLRELPSQLIVYGIEGQAFAAGEKLSPKIETAIPALAAQVLAECRNLAG
jgi:hydrogenase maturation protease